MNEHEASEQRILEAIAALRSGRSVLLSDNPDREHEADFVMAAEFATPEAVNLALTKARSGVLCVALASDRADALGLPVIRTQFTNRFSPGFTLSVDLKEGNTTGISVQDRSRTIQAFVNPETRIQDFVIPGHVFPIRAEQGSLLTRQGHTEGSVDLMKIAGLAPAAVICEVLGQDGSALRGELLKLFVQEHHWPHLYIQDILDYRLRHESLVALEASAHLPTAFGPFETLVYSMPGEANPVVALVRRGSRVHWGARTPVRLHSECFTGDVLGSLRCDCGGQLLAALESIDRAGEGVFLYLPQEGRGIGLAEKIKAYALQEQGMDTVDANIHLGHPIDARQYSFAAQVLRDLGLHSVQLLTNNPAKVEGLQKYGVHVADRLPLQVKATAHNLQYLKTKQERLGHLLTNLIVNP